MRTTALRALSALAAASLVLAACGGDDDATPDIPEGGTGNPYTQAIIESWSHDEIVFPSGGDMVVAVNCEAETGGTVVTAVAEGLDVGTYTGVFDPATGTDLVLQVTGSEYSIATAEMTLDAESYTVTFADIEGGEFEVSGC